MTATYLHDIENILCNTKTFIVLIIMIITSIILNFIFIMTTTDTITCIVTIAIYF